MTPIRARFVGTCVLCSEGHSEAANAYAATRWVPDSNGYHEAATSFDAAFAWLAQKRIGAGHVRVGDVLDITHRVIVTAVGDECDVSTDDGLNHNLHAYNVTAHLVNRPDPRADLRYVLRQAIDDANVAAELSDTEADDILNGLIDRNYDITKRADS